MIRSCTSCHHVYDDAYKYTSCPHMPIGAGPTPFHPTSNPSGYCKEHDLFACKIPTHAVAPHPLLAPAFIADMKRKAAPTTPHIRLPNGEPFPKEEKMPTDKQANVSGQFYRPLTAGIRPATEGPLQVLQFASGAGAAIQEAAEEIARYHIPTEDTQYQYRNLERALTDFLTCIVRNCPPGPERSTAISRAREAKMWAAAAISLEPQP